MVPASQVESLQAPNALVVLTPTHAGDGSPTTIDLVDPD